MKIIKPKTMAQLRKRVYPASAYQAHLDDGTVFRMTFWAHYGASDQELIYYGRIGVEVIIEHGSARGRRLIAGYVEDKRYPGRPWLVDDISTPLETMLSAPKKRVTTQTLRLVLGDLITAARNGGIKEAALQEAEKLLAA